MLSFRSANINLQLCRTYRKNYKVNKTFTDEFAGRKLRSLKMRLFKILFKDIGIQKILKKTSIHIIRNSRFRGKRIGLSGSRRVKRTISQKGLSSFSIRLKYIQYTKYERRFTNPPIASAVAESQILETPIPLTNLQKSSPTITTAWKPKDSKTSLGC